MEEDPVATMIFLGDREVGKTCIIRRYVYGKFDEKTLPTQDIAFFVKDGIKNKR